MADHISGPLKAALLLFLFPPGAITAWVIKNNNHKAGRNASRS
jgi:hypothetical protein